MPFVTTDAILGAAVLSQVTNTSHRAGAVVRKAKNSGAAAIQQQYLARMEEVTTLTSTDCGGALGFGTSTFATVGLSVLAGTITVPYKNRTNAGLFQGATSHSRLTGSNALIIPTGIEASQDSEVGASITSEIHWLSADGTTQATTGSVANSIASEAFQGEFALGPVDINGTDLASCVGISINPGITVVKTSSCGGVWPQEVSIQMVEPTVDVTVHDIDELATYMDGATDITSFECYLRERADGGTYTADITEQHIKFSFAAGIGTPESIDGPETGNGTATMRIHGNALTVSVASAIT